MGCNTSKPSNPTTDTSNGKMIGKCRATGDKISLFNGLLYRIEDTQRGRWSFYNNCKEYEFHIKYLFGLDSQFDTLGDTTLEEQDDGYICEMVIYPLETKEFVEGTVEGYESKIEALPLSEEYFSKHPELDEAAYYRRLEPPRSADF